MNKNYSFDIGITTFSLRLDMLKNLIKDIRSFTDNNILLCVNGEKYGNFDDMYRNSILDLSKTYKNIFPIFFIDLRGLAKMWNTIIVHALKDNILLLNDDIIIQSSNIFEVVEQHISDKEYNGLSIINETFSFFVVNKYFIHDLGYFDERLLGFGEEDGDIKYRIKQKYNKNIGKINCSGINNIISDIRHPGVKNGIGKYSLFNRTYIFNEKYNCNGNIYYFPDNIECEKKIEDYNCYPYENFYLTNKHKLFE
jgi:hypothetical protein